MTEMTRLEHQIYDVLADLYDGDRHKHRTIAGDIASLVSKPNRVVIEMAGTAIVQVLAEWPDKVVVIVVGPGGPMTFPYHKVYGGPDGLPIRQLGVEEDNDGDK